MNVASPSSTCKDGLGNSLYLQRRQEQCTVCPDYFECDTCIKVSLPYKMLFFVDGVDIYLARYIVNLTFFIPYRKKCSGKS